MKRLLSGALALTLLFGTTGMAAADSYRSSGHYDRGGHGSGHSWRSGERVDRSEYGRWDRADYHRYHLATPRRGYEWRRGPDGRFFEIALATGLIIAIANSH